jgi:hypothetical protein
VLGDVPALIPVAEPALIESWTEARASVSRFPLNAFTEAGT